MIVRRVCTRSILSIKDEMQYLIHNNCVTGYHKKDIEADTEKINQSHIE